MLLAKKAYGVSKRRAKIVRELVDTEKSYVTTIEGICKCFLYPLQHLITLGEPMVSQDDIALLFSSIEQIYFSQQTILKAFQERIAKWHTQQTIGDVIGRIVHSLALVVKSSDQFFCFLWLFWFRWTRNYFNLT